jgi:hypothetical protein
MIAYEIDPSLHQGAPKPQALDDGFSRPQHGEAHPQPSPLPPAEAQDAEHQLTEKSAF